MSNFGIFKGFSEKLYAGELPTFLGIIGSFTVLIFTFRQWQNITPQTWNSINSETWN